MADFEADFNLEEQPEIEAVFSIDVEVKKHNDLIDRDAENCHPMGAITGLTEAIESKQDVITDLNEIREGAALGATAVQSVESGTENGTISVDGSDVSVTGLGSAAFTASTDYDVAGAASTAEQNAKNYADSLSSNYATAEQGQKADTAVQTIETGTTDGTISVDGTEVAVAGLGSAAYTASTDYATSAQGALADSALQPTDVIDDTVSTDTDKPLSANMGKSLQDQVDNLKARGRFLALWNCATGLAQTNPPTGTYEYKAGDYFIVGTVATGGANNYRPTGSSYTTGVASTVVETRAVDTDDVYYYDGTNWALQINTQKTIGFGNIAGSPYDNSNLASALNDKQDALVEGTGISIGSDNTISNSGVRSISTGASNGTISVNTNGTSAEVAVYGLGSAAYTSSTDYATSAQGTKADTAVQPGDLATVATTGAYGDLSGTPTIPTVNNSTITFTQGGVTKGSITLNQSSDETIALDAGGGVSSLTDIAAAGTAIEFTNQRNDDYTVVGSPTIVDGIATGFSSTNYIKKTLNYIPTTNAEFITKVNQSVRSGNQWVLNIPFVSSGLIGIAYNGYLYLYGTGWGTVSYAVGSYMWIRLVYTIATGTWDLYGLADNGYTLDTLPALSNWEHAATATRANPFYGEISIGGPENVPWNGYIDLNNTELLVDGAIAWRPIGYVSPITTINAKVMTGASSGTAGATGLVPEPAAGDQTKFLRGDGTWQTVGGTGIALTDIATAGDGITFSGVYTQNFTISGSPTITNGVVSNLSGSNYLTAPAILSAQPETFELTTVMTRTGSDNYQAAFANMDVQLFKHATGNDFGTYNSTSGDVTSGSITVNTTFWAKAVLTANSLTIYSYTYTEGVEPPASLSSWTTHATVTNSTALGKYKNLFLAIFRITGNIDPNFSSQYWHGTIDLNKTSLVADGVLVWQPYTEDKTKISETYPNYYGTCSTAAATQEKVVLCPDFVLKTGAVIRVKFTNETSVAPYLNVNGTGAISVKHSTNVQMNAAQTWQPDNTVTFVYDGTYWIIDNRKPATTLYYGPTILLYSDAMTSTSTSVALTPRALRQTVYNLIAKYPTYSTSSTYAVGDRVLYSYNVWECNTAITTAEAWTASHWTKLDPLQKQIDDKIGDIETLLAQV